MSSVQKRNMDVVTWGQMLNFAGMLLIEWFSTNNVQVQARWEGCLRGL